MSKDTSKETSLNDEVTLHSTEPKHEPDHVKEAHNVAHKIVNEVLSVHEAAHANGTQLSDEHKKNLHETVAHYLLNYRNEVAGDR